MSRTLSVEPVRSRLQAEMQSAYGRIEVLDAAWPLPVDVTVIEHHPVLELSLNSPAIRTAEGRFRASGANPRFRRVGKALFKPPGIPLHVVARSGEAYSVRCIFNERCEALRLHAEDWNRSQLNACLDIHDSSIQNLLMRLAQEVKSPGFASAMLVDATATAIMVELTRYLRGIPNSSHGKTGGLAPRQLRRVQEFIAGVDGAMPTSSEISTVAGVSCRHLTRAFKQSTGQTLKQYIEEIQLSKARLWLTESDLPIKQIAARLGFSHAKNFSAAFHRATSQSPNTFRQENRRRRG